MCNINMFIDVNINEFKYNYRKQLEGMVMLAELVNAGNVLSRNTFYFKPFKELKVEKPRVEYTVSKTENGYQVYSYESWVHEVDASWEVTYDWQIESAKQAAKKERNENRDARTVVLKTIQKFQRFQILMDAHTIEDENDIRLATVMIQTFEKETGECWQKTVWDIREENVYRQRLNSYVFFKLLDLEKEFRRLQDEDTSSQKGVILVWGTDLWD